MARVRRVLAATGVLAVLVGGYVIADARDLAPGVLTTLPPWPEAEPFPEPSAPGEAVIAEVLASLDPTAPIPDVDPVQASLDELLEDSRLGHSVGAIVTDVATSQVLAAHEEDRGRAPASTIKMLTAVGAALALDLDARLPTTVVQGSEPDQIVLVGHGDMALARGHGDPNATIGHAGIDDLADALATRLLGEERTTVRLAVDDTLFAGPIRAPGWVDLDFTGGYVAPISPLGIEIGVIQGRTQRETDPALATGRALAQSLAEHGIEVQGSVSRGRAPAGAGELARVESAAIGAVLDVMMHESSNTLAEVLGRLVAIADGQPATFDGATTAVLNRAASIGVDLSAVVMVDCSGLSSQSRISPGLLVHLVSALDDAALPGLIDVAAALPVAGLEGTLDQRYTGTAAGLVRAKTGTLPGVVSLAGYAVTNDGRLLAFAVMADDVPHAGSWGARSAVDEWIESLVACGCTTAPEDGDESEGGG